LYKRIAGSDSSTLGRAQFPFVLSFFEKLKGWLFSLWDADLSKVEVHAYLG
jgi:hypothetical protein